jgi:hypothetical protein
VSGPATTALSMKWQLKPGDIVTFKHRGFWLGSGKPKSPTIYRVRPDISWQYLLDSVQLRSTPIGLGLRSY